MDDVVTSSCPCFASLIATYQIRIPLAQLYSMSVAQETPTICHSSYFLAGVNRFIHSPVDGHLGSH